MRTVFFIGALVLWSACTSALLPRPIKSRCAVPTDAFIETAVKVFERNGYYVRTTDFAKGEIVGFKPEKIFMLGDSPVKAGPYLVTARLQNDTLTITVFTVKDDEKTPERSWDETATDEFEKSQYMPLLSDLRALCRPGTR